VKLHARARCKVAYFVDWCISILAYKDIVEPEGSMHEVMIVRMLHPEGYLNHTVKNDLHVT